MIHAINISVLMFGIVSVAVFNLRARGLFFRADTRIQKYKLFRIRDNLVHLVAEDKLSEESYVFGFFYHAIDFFIQHTDQLSLKSVVTSLRQAQERGLDPAATQEVERVRNQLGQENPEVREAVSDFYATMMQVLMENSFVVRFIVSHADAWRAVNELGRILGNLFSTERLAYRFYQEYKTAARTTAHAT